ncbi:MAG: hypothetical protein Q8891_10085 [Bacteroidota bacterium]|jgi:hypothetical protein|nr:hypothetical protein [Bacteroidota bacterium]
MIKAKLTAIAFMGLVFFSCNSNDNGKEEVINEEVQDTLSSSGNSSDSLQKIINRPLIWSVESGKNNEKEKLKKPEDVKLDTFSSVHLIQLINNNYPDVQLELEKISHDTMYVKIPDSKKLTEEMGSTGAENYMASATYTLTELKNVKFINFAMKIGDHAGPGVFSREDFQKFR